MSDKKLPNTAYILLWFPKPSETFVFSEVENLLKLGLPVSVYTLYGRLEKDLSSDMQSYQGKILRLGVWWGIALPIFIFYWFLRSPVKTTMLIVRIVLRRWKGVEKTAENVWACFCAFYLAYRFEKDQIKHIHAPWACGCATAAWLASRLTGIPFSFAMHAWDIYPPDSLIQEKTRDALFVRSVTQYNIEYLRKLTACSEDKFHLIYIGVPMSQVKARHVSMEPPYQLLAVGRLVGKKGYEFLLRACGVLKANAIDFHLNIVGDGLYLNQLQRLCASLELESVVTFHGFQPYEKMPTFFQEADIFIMPCVVHSSGDRDGIPTVLMEALLHYVPVITTSVSGIPELIEDGVSGVLVPEKDPNAIVDAVTLLITEKQKAWDMADRGNRKVLELFNAEKNHKKILDLYNSYLLN
ncbi:glycosyltransferase [Desulfocapsa sulfexigens DSM 10523]|uniref:Glycosyltransferase n=2 Tax=Desulfocapsa TaxID=53318 RepID=M1PA75_DESSD|nr:glycosyltransferase [Desulfocapsa sulfexigens DSM 10523]